MWCLKGREGFCVYILPNQKKLFGKSLSDIKLEGDVTISRRHAIISVEPTEESQTQYKCVINDISKYGTFIIRDKKKEKLLTDKKFILKAGDIVQFGLKESTFVVLCYSFVIAKSSLNEEDLRKLNDIVSNLKAKLSETWADSCTHLTVAKNTLFTTKFACALASAKPIVTNAYWEAVDTAVKESKELPKIEDFLPKVKEEWLKVCSNLFLPNEKRSTLFKGLSFVHFCTKQYFAYASLITAAGGKSCVYPTKRPLTPRDLTAKNAIVIQQPTNDSSQLTQAIIADYPVIYHKLQGVKRRMISDSEIPLAILYCTTEIYCNPKYDFATFLKLETPTFVSSDVIIENTQDIVNTGTRQIKRKIIPETCESQNNETVLKKIHCSDENKIKHISSVNKSNIAMTQNTDNVKFKRKIIPETCDSQINKKNSKNYFYGNEWKNMSDINESNIAMKNMENADTKQIKCKMIGKTYDSQNNENISKKILFNESEQYVSDTSQTNISAKIQSKNIIKSVSFSNESESKHISDMRIDMTCEFNEKIVNNFATEKEQQNVKLQKQKVFKENNVTFTKNNQEKNMSQENKYGFQQENIIINEKNTSLKKNVNKEENLIVEKDNSNNNSKYTIASWENSKNVKPSQSVSIKEMSNNEIYIKGKKDNLYEKNCSTVELQNSLKQKLISTCNSEKNRENKKVKEEDKIQTKNNKKELRKIEDNWYKKCLNQGFTDEILRKDVPCGKNFIKTFIIKPEKILRTDDFVL